MENKGKIYPNCPTCKYSKQMPTESPCKCKFVKPSKWKLKGE